ncbi:LysR substrate-binding domain-containing protein (plasmid) [Limimaricola variabilis]|uniref:LysR substrate-binding domain-containing protein n=1 Tax=Limimaricola variabilis TaxID=1492771 RepID=UPI002AC9D54A|nr:LysR substrate-binding domain-containing protein [Limimaricola variabilis]WPY96670.1 LysR substrate-binding domain-containing protein [Limimaricola variabilis]
MNDRLLRRGLKLGHLELLAQLEQSGQLGAAAEALGIAQPAASRLLSEAERIAGCALRRRDGRGIRLTPEGAALARRAGRVLGEIGDAGRELDEIASGLSGEVRIGAVTGPAMDRVLPALRRARTEMPKLRVHVENGDSEVLGEALLEGRIDLALARLPHAHPAERFDIRPIGPEPVALVVRRGHPLLADPAPTPEAILAHDWVLPARGTLLHDAVQRRLARLGLPPPHVPVTTSSVLLTLALVQDGDAVAPLARAVAAHVAGAGCAVVPVDLGLSVAPYGLITRAGALLPVAARRMAELLLRDPADPAPSVPPEM